MVDTSLSNFRCILNEENTRKHPKQQETNQQDQAHSATKQPHKTDPDKPQRQSAQD
ncbi:unnamed protein product [Rhodiola kirilowii]